MYTRTQDIYRTLDENSLSHVQINVSILLTDKKHAIIKKHRFFKFLILVFKGVKVVQLFSDYNHYTPTENSHTI